jgi:hypothetical protein
MTSVRSIGSDACFHKGHETQQCPSRQKKVSFISSLSFTPLPLSLVVFSSRHLRLKLQLVAGCEYTYIFAFTAVSCTPWLTPRLMESIKLHLNMMFTLPPGFVSYFLTSQLRPLPSPTTSYEGKTVIVTGANVGLGLEAARHFARLGAAKVILACRNTKQGKAAKRDIETMTATSNVVDVWPLDLTSFESVRQFCRRADAELERLDVVVENAGVATPHFQDAEGFESTITINVISTFLMALLLLPKLRKTAAQFNTMPHLTIVSSDAHVFVCDLAPVPAFRLPADLLACRTCCHVVLADTWCLLSHKPSQPGALSRTDSQEHICPLPVRRGHVG